MLLLDVDISFSSLRYFHVLAFLAPTLMHFFHLLDPFGDKDCAENSDLDSFITSVLVDDGILPGSTPRFMDPALKTC